MMTKDYRVEIRVKNGPLYRAMQEEGFETAADLARAANVCQKTLSAYSNLRLAPLGPKGWGKNVLRLASTLRRLPEDLFPEQHIERAMKRNSAIVEMDLREVEALVDSGTDPERELMAQEAENTLCGALQSVNNREERVLRLLYGVGFDRSHTLDEVAAEFNVSRERVRQIQFRGLDKLKRGRFGTDLRDAADALCAA